MIDFAWAIVTYWLFWLIFWHLYRRWYGWMEQRPGPSIAPPTPDRWRPRVRARVMVDREWRPVDKHVVALLTRPRSTGNLGPGVGRMHSNCPTCTCKYPDPTGRF